jgi:hypothetical protein
MYKFSSTFSMFIEFYLFRSTCFVHVQGYYLLWNKHKNTFPFPSDQPLADIEVLANTGCNMEMGIFYSVFMLVALLESLQAILVFVD